ncbi:cell division protein SepF [Actinoplanes regularis]|uniref:cell division protein SepF n=1 Tax=Actinoplanes regularis TaxID=52697 RepID=UPI00255367C4|nr:cell division protein SepF [Actinoplanes regularis]
MANAIADALKLSEYRAGRGVGPAVKMGSLKRFSPASFHNASMEITQRLRSGQPISLDLHSMNDTEGRRLVDFCSGQIAGTSGWIIQLSDEVLVLVPGNE